MAIESTLHSSIGTYSFDASKLSPADLQKLNAATGPDGQTDPSVLVEIRDEYPAAFQLVDRANGLPLPQGPYEKPDYPDITDKFAAMLLAVEQKSVESLSDTRKAMNDAAIAEAAQYMASKTQEKDKGLKAAQTKYTADVTSSSTQLASSGLQAGMAGLQGAKVAQGAVKTASMSTHQDAMKGLKAERKSLEAPNIDLKNEYRQATTTPARKVEIHAEIATNRARNAPRLAAIDEKVGEHNGDFQLAQEQSRQHNEESRYLGSTAQAVGGAISGGGSTAAAGSNFDSAVITANEKMDDASAQNHATNRDLFNGGAQDILRVLGEILSAQNQTAQSGIDASKTIARNV